LFKKFLGFLFPESHAIFGTLSESVKSQLTVSFNRQQQFKQFLTVLTAAFAQNRRPSIYAIGNCRFSFIRCATFSAVRAPLAPKKVPTI